ncbi:uracil-DNA glycosylase [Stieleria sp. JC731]|uniref:uracil-DNA glycosylase n=1 Tax=Pirellulaceae TaxID=2691357 RepID=UPI001E4B5B5E|nr:uracil-DNA glycosylase [Stieleria sp. JC731]MCC9601860.1 uracil-DNA glycosylase [Stieleria sp. JC731]
MNDSSKKLDPSTVLSGTGALADHLQRLGVQWLPQVNADSVNALAEFFAIGGTDEEHSSAKPAVSDAPAAAISTASQPTETVAPPQTSAPAFSLSGEVDNAAASYPGTSLSAEARTERLAKAAERVAGCMKCEVLAKCRTKTVYGEGNVSPRVVFFGEGPGRDEDISGRPFVGKAGQLLTKMIEACQFKREDVYIMNTVKCRPPNNRNPETTEIENCREYFEAQLDTLRPEYIVCLGLVSAQALLKNKLSVGRMRGKFHRYFDSKVLVTYHPSYLLRTPAAKKAAWSDLQIMLRDAGMI